VNQELAGAHNGYRAAGFATIPVARDKTPLVKWQEYQDRLPSNEEIEEWCEMWPDSNVALVMGNTGHVAIDIDGDLKKAYAALQEKGVQLPPTAPVQKTGKGYHVLLSVPKPVRDSVGWMKGDGWQIDIRGIGYIVVAPSVHASGFQYRWVKPFVTPIPAAPEALLGVLGRRGEEQAAGLFAPEAEHPTWVAELLYKGSPEGQRNQDGAKLAGYLFKALPDDLARVTMHMWGERCKPPLPSREVETICASIARRAAHQKLAPALDPDALRAEVVSKSTGQLVGSLLATRAKTIQTPTDFVSLPYSTLNKCLFGGLARDEYLLLAARESVGKTAMALEIADLTAARGHRVLFCSLEMAAEAVADRLVVRHSGLDAGEIRAGGLHGEKLAKFEAAVRDLATLPLVIESGLNRADQIYAHVDQAAKDGEPYDLVLVDYLQEMKAVVGRKDQPRIEIKESSAILREITKKLHVPVIAISSLARRQNNPPPKNTDLKESGDLEYQADVIVLLHREQFQAQVHVMVSKARNARQGSFWLYYDGSRYTFSETPGRSFSAAPVEQERNTEQPF